MVGETGLGRLAFCACDLGVGRLHVNDVGAKAFCWGPCPLVYISLHLYQCVVTLQKYYS